MGKILKVNAPMTIEDGKHTGVITAIEYREKPYEYTDLVIEFENGKRIKAGFPTFLSPTSKLGKLLEACRIKLDIGLDLDIENILIGMKVEFMTIKKGLYSEVIDGSIKRID